MTSGYRTRLSRLLPGALAAVLLILIVLPSRAQLPDSLSSGARVSVLTVNPGNAIYSFWGHSALRVSDPAYGLDAVFNWGTFDPERPWFIPRFAYGDMQYELSVESMSRFLRGATLEERGVIEQQLVLGPLKTQALWELLLENMLPENRTYAYDFVRDNCSTRILDLLEAVDAVQLTEVNEEATYRSMVDHYVHQEAWLDLGIDLAFGARMDRPVDTEGRAFLPLALMDLLESARTPSGDSLVSGTRALIELPWNPAKEGYTRVQWLFWAIGALIIVYTLRTRDEPGPLDRALLFVLGSIGLFLLLMWLATKHWVTTWNMDVLWALPTHLVAAIVWKRWKGLSAYLRISALVMIGGLILQMAGLQPVPPAMILFALACAIRFGMVGRMRASSRSETSVS